MNVIAFDYISLKELYNFLLSNGVSFVSLSDGANFFTKDQLIIEQLKFFGEVK